MATSKSSTGREAVRSTAKSPRSQKPLISSPAMAKREMAKLRRGRDELESEATTADTSVRSSLI
jgi:hypothetical protein